MNSICQCYAKCADAYLMRNDAVVVSSEVSDGWNSVQGAEVIVTDAQENTVWADTTGQASGYTAGKYLRDPDASDLVRIEQADQAYWSDIAHVKVTHMVNVRSHPWYTASIVTTLDNGTPLYIVSTVDNWSLIRNDEGTIRGYIRSDFLEIEKSQRVDITRGMM
jgi:Bacterial SH3 domain